MFAVEVAAAVAGVGRFAAAAIVEVFDGKATSAFPNKSYLHHSELIEALFLEPWHGMESGESFGWQEGAAGDDSSRDKE
jgi:hypothetical protein